MKCRIKRYYLKFAPSIWWGAQKKGKWFWSSSVTIRGGTREEAIQNYKEYLQGIEWIEFEI
jgi:hypothetical protein